MSEVKKRVPGLRFPGFDEEWKKKKLGEIGEILMCKRIFSNETNLIEGVPFFKIGTLGNEPDAFISKKLFEEYKIKYNYPRKGEILITCSGTVGKCIIFDGEDAYFQDSNIVWVNNPTEEIKNNLLFYILSDIDWSKLNSTTITRIYGADLRNLLLFFPSNSIEQQKISNFLSSIDEQIQLLKERKKQLETYKKGVMQKIFNEEIRFKDDNGEDYPEWKKIK